MLWVKHPNKQINKKIEGRLFALYQPGVQHTSPNAQTRTVTHTLLALKVTKGLSHPNTGQCTKASPRHSLVAVSRKTAVSSCMWVAHWMSCKILGAKTACQTIPQLKFIPSHSPVLHRCQQAPKSSRYYRYISPPPYKSNPIHNIPGMILFQSRVLLTSKIQLAEGKASQQLLRRSSCRCSSSGFICAFPLPCKWG